MGIVSPSLWFNGNAEEAMRFYVSVFPNSGVRAVTRYTEAGPGPEGEVMTVSFTLDGLEFTGINAGPEFPFTEAVSFVIDCETQSEVDHYWEWLVEGGEPGPCRWLKDRFGLSWQVAPPCADGAAGDRGSGASGEHDPGDVPDDEARHRHPPRYLGEPIMCVTHQPNQSRSVDRLAS